MQTTPTPTPPEPKQEPLKTEEQRKVNELFAQMNPVQRMNTLAWMMGLLAARVQWPNA
jgi:hypothetical protein